MSYTYEDQVKIELVKKGIVGKENADLISQAKSENQITALLWSGKGEDKSILRVLLRLVGLGKEE